MVDDQDLLDRFAPLADAMLAEAPSVAALRARVVRRRHRRRSWAGGAAAALALAGLGTWVAVTARAPTRDRVATQPEGTEEPADDRPLSATVGTGPRLVIGWLPDGLPSPTCRHPLPARRELLRCMVDRAAITLERGAAPDAVQNAWERRDAAGVATALGRSAAGAAFIVIDGGPVLALGEGSYVIVADADVVDLSLQPLSDQQAEQIIAGVQTEPEDPGFRLPTGMLPDGAQPLTQGQVRPEVGAARAGRARGITYELPAAGTQPTSQLSISVVRDVDANSFLAAWSAQQRLLTQQVPERFERTGRSGLLVRRVGQVAVAAAIDDRAVVLVDAPEAKADDAVAMAASVVLR